MTEPDVLASYEFELPWPRPPLNLNDRRHWRANAAKVPL